MATNNDIRYCLDTALSSIPNLPVIVPENTNSFPQDPVAHLEPRLIPTSRRAMTMGQDPYQDKIGFYRVTVRMPLNQGTGEQFSIADTIERYFKPGRYLSALKTGESLLADFTNDVYLTDTVSTYLVIDYSETNGSYEESPYYCTPVDIGWHCINL